MNKSLIHKKPNLIEIDDDEEFMEPTIFLHHVKIPVACACWTQNENGTHTYHMFEQPFVPYDVHVVGDIDYFYKD